MLAARCKTLLGFSGHVVETAHDGETGISKALLMKPSVVLLDLTLPDMTGFDVLGKLRESEVLSSTLFIAVTGRENDGSSAAAGFDHHLIKPVDVQHLEHLIENHLA